MQKNVFLLSDQVAHWDIVRAVNRNRYILKFLGVHQQEGWVRLFMDSSLLPTIDCVETDGKAFPIVLAFFMPIRITSVFSQRMLRVFSIYRQPLLNGKGWDLMRGRTIEYHSLVCEVN